VAAAITQSIALVQSITYATSSSNAAPTRVLEFGGALSDIGWAIDAGDNTGAQTATKRALEAIHELADCLKRGEWRQSDWDADSIGLWTGLLGARNAAHHTSSSVVVKHSDMPRDDRLRWDLDADVIAGLHSPAQKVEYNARVAGQPVLPQLRSVLGLLTAAAS
jgi:hypothetical protein